VYVDQHNILRIKVEQREPVLRILDNNGNNYYLDENGVKMPPSKNFAARALVASRKYIAVSDRLYHQEEEQYAERSLQTGADAEIGRVPERIYTADTRDQRWRIHHGPAGRRSADNPRFGEKAGRQVPPAQNFLQGRYARRRLEKIPVHQPEIQWSDCLQITDTDTNHGVMKQILKITLLLLVPALMQAQAQQATLLGRWDDPAIIGSAAYNNRYNEVWSVAVNGHEYAVLGSTMGTHFIDVTDPENPFQADFVPGKAQGAGIIHRDFETYKNYIYGVCDEGASSLQVMDVSTLPDSVRLVYNSNQIIVTTHNIFVDTARARLYAFVFGGWSGVWIRRNGRTEPRQSGGADLYPQVQ
jgi:hypothetical protein